MFAKRGADAYVDSRRLVPRDGWNMLLKLCTNVRVATMNEVSLLRLSRLESRIKLVKRTGINRIC